MADILSQDEVDLLLSAVSEGEVTPEETAVGGDADEDVLTKYDFKRPERVSKEQLKGLQSLFESFSREASIILPPFLRTVVRVDLSSIDQLTYDEFTLSVARPTSLSIVDMAPLEGRSLLELSPTVVFPIVDRVLGGRGIGLDEPRELTEIENRIIQRIVTMMLDCLRQAWEHLIEFRLKVVGQESDPLIVQIVAGSEMVVLVGYDVHVGDSVGSMNMCLPLMVLNPVLDLISQEAQFRRPMSAETARRMREQISHTLLKTKVPVEAFLGNAELTLEDVAHLQIGDVITLDRDATQPIPVHVGGIERFAARPGRRGEQSAIQLTELVVDD